jgi:hypothetical protein
VKKQEVVMHPVELAMLRDRRRFLLRTACGLGTIALADLLRLDARTTESTVDPLTPRKPHFKPRAKNVIFLFMAGGPSQVDLFDPKPMLERLHGKPVPESYLKTLDDPVIKAGAKAFASPRTFTRHGRCGMQFSDWMPALANHADDLCMIRSMWTDVANHDPGQLLMQCGISRFGHPCMGSWVTYGLGSESRNLPGFVVMLSNSGKGLDAGSALWSNGFLPSVYRGVTFRDKGDPILHLSSPPGVSQETQRAKLDALADLNRLREKETGDPEIESRVAAYELAYRMQSAGPELIDFAKEKPATLEAYGINNATTRWFGTNCLLARRMVERGVRFVNLYHTSWDDHLDLNTTLKQNCDMTDQPVAALLADLKQRGLLDETLVIWGGEFGRTPMVEVRRGLTPGKEGRDHHPFGFTMLLAGGGIKGGQVIGKTDELGYHAIEDRIHPNDLQATLLHCLGLEHTKLTYRHQGREFRLTDVAGKVVEQLLK